MELFSQPERVIIQSVLVSRAIWQLSECDVALTGHIALSLVNQCALGMDQSKQRSLPRSVIDVCHMVYQAKCSLIKVGFTPHNSPQ